MLGMWNVPVALRFIHTIKKYFRILVQTEIAVNKINNSLQSADFTLPLPNLTRRFPEDITDPSPCSQALFNGGHETVK